MALRIRRDLVFGVTLVWRHSNCDQNGSPKSTLQSLPSDNSAQSMCEDSTGLLSWWKPHIEFKIFKLNPFFSDNAIACNCSQELLTGFVFSWKAMRCVAHVGMVLHWKCRQFGRSAFVGWRTPKQSWEVKGLVSFRKLESAAAFEP